MIDVMAKVIKEVPETILLVLGDRNSFVDELEELILNCKLENNIIFTGYIDRSNMKNYYALANIVVVPSVCFDSFPTVNLEAMSCKKPVITSCFGGGREAVVNEKTGFIINPMNIDIFSNKIIYILKIVLILKACLRIYKLKVIYGL